MAKGRSGANRGWRSKMKQALEKDPALQAQVKGITLDSLNRVKSDLEASATAISAELVRLQAEIDALTVTPEPSA